jgi:hypothetical protein
LILPVPRLGPLGTKQQMNHYSELILERMRQWVGDCETLLRTLEDAYRSAYFRQRVVQLFITVGLNPRPKRGFQLHVGYTVIAVHLAHVWHANCAKTTGKLQIMTDWQSVGPGARAR